MVNRLMAAPGPGPRAPARLLAACLIATASMQPALAQRRPAPAAPAPAQARPPQAAPAPSPVPVPDQRTSLKLLWSMMAAVDQANRTGNYSVLRDLGSTGFQTNNNPATLAGVFAGIRGRNVDLADTLTVAPNWEIAPTLMRSGALRMRGSFPLRPTAVAFDLIFAWERGEWRLDAVAVQAR
jgi:hypothetical protein